MRQPMFKSYLRKTTLFTCCILGLILNLAITPTAWAQTSQDKAVQTVVKILINAIRYHKDSLAAKQLAFATMAESLMGDTWQQLSAVEQTELTHNLEALLRNISFAKGREMFQYLDAILYKPSFIQADIAHCPSTIVIYRDLKKTEIAIEWLLKQEQNQWKIIDTIMLGESTLASIREEEVDPLLKSGGTAAVLDAMRKKVAEVSKQALSPKPAHLP